MSNKKRPAAFRQGRFGACELPNHSGPEVTAVCSTRNVDTARSIGEDHVIDYTREDFTRSGRRYDLILGANAIIRFSITGAR